MGNNPIWYNDVMGDEVDGDEKGKQNYKNYRTEINARIDKIKESMKGVNENTEEYKALNDQLTSYNNINKELNALEADKKNLYYINSDVVFPPKDGDGKTEGQTYYHSDIIWNGVAMRQINIDLSKQIFPMSNLAHEFKHAYQFYEGRLIFVAGTKAGFNSKEFEFEAHERGDRFSGYTMGNNGSFNMGYRYKPALLFENYKSLPDKVQSIFDSNFKMQLDYLIWTVMPSAVTSGS